MSNENKYCDRISDNIIPNYWNSFALEAKFCPNFYANVFQICLKCAAAKTK